MHDREKVIERIHDAIDYGVCVELFMDILDLLKEQETEIDEISDEYLDLGKEMAKQPDIVRCKDCKYYNSEPDSHGDRCDKIHWSRNDDWFCADGERS